MEKRNYIYIEFYKEDGESTEWRGFFTSEIEELMESGIIDTDMLGYAMKDMDSFNKAYDELVKTGKPFGYKEWVDKYIELSGQEVRIAL